MGRYKTSLDDYGLDALIAKQETEFNDQVEELKSIHNLVDTITGFLFYAGSNVGYASRAFRGCQLLRMRLNAVLHRPQYRHMYGGHIKQIDELMATARELLEVETERALNSHSRTLQWPGASPRLLNCLDALFNELIVIKNEIGIGIKSKRVWSDADAIAAATE